MRRYIFKGNSIKLIMLFVLECLKIVGTVGVAVVLSIQVDSISSAIDTGSTEPLISCAYICLIYAVMLGLVIFLTDQIKAITMRDIMISLRYNIFSSIFKRKYCEKYGRNTAEYIALFNGHLNTIEENYLKNMISIVESTINIVVATILLILINPIIAVTSIIAMSIPSIIPKIFGKKLARCQSDIMKYTDLYIDKIKDIFGGYEVIKTYRCEKLIQKKHDTLCKDYENSKKGMAQTMAKLYGITNMSSVLTQFFIMIISGIFAVNKLITIGNIIAITQLTGQAILPAFQLSTKISQLKSTKPIFDKLEMELICDDSDIAIANAVEVKKNLKVKNLSFEQSGTPIIKDANLMFEMGKKYMLIGKSGSGKSTFLRLLSGYYDNYSGDILIDGRNDVMCDCSMIHQNVFLFNDTIRNNITLYGYFDEKEIYAAIHAAGIDEVIEKLPNGIDTFVEENGSRFSGGERQRIAIARAILHKKSVFLIDEATSALDKNTANKVENSILELKNIICINVTHDTNLESRKKYDKIYEIENGYLIEA